MAEICPVCNEEKIWGFEYTVQYNGFTFRTTKIPSNCQRCEGNLFIEMFRRNEGTLVAVRDGRLVVDWALYLRRGGGSGEVNEILLALGVFSFEAEGNWEIVDEGPIGLNPRTGGHKYIFFVRREDVVTYAQLKLSKTLYYWEIRHIDCVISKAKALEF